MFCQTLSDVQCIMVAMTELKKMKKSSSFTLRVEVDTNWLLFFRFARKWVFIAAISVDASEKQAGGTEMETS